MAFEPNWNDSPPPPPRSLKHHSAINTALSPPMGDVKYSLGFVIMIRKCSCLQKHYHHCLSRVFAAHVHCVICVFLRLSELLFSASETTHLLLSSTLSVIFLLCLFLCHAVVCLCIKVQNWEPMIKYSLRSTVAQPPCHQLFLSCHLLPQADLLSPFIHTCCLYFHISELFFFAVCHFSPSPCIVSSSLGKHL